MDVAGGSPVRLVVQYLGKSQPESYRVIVYPDRARFHRPLLFASRPELAHRLSKILPDFDPKVLEPAGDSFPQIVLAESVQLSDSQLAELWKE